MDYKYYLTSSNRASKPRSKRLRNAGQTVSSHISSSVSVTGSGGVTPGHSHSNMSALDRILFDDDGYLLVSTSTDVVDEDSGEVNIVVTEDKVKAGWADVAKDLSPDSPIWKKFLRRDVPDIAEGEITFEQGVQLGKAFAEGLDGFGGMLDKAGNGWLGGLHLRDFLEVPEIRFNRVEVSIGNDWNAPGGGVIESVVPDADADGNVLPTGTIKLHLEDGELGAVAVDDICHGIFHNELQPGNNAIADSDDGKGNFIFAGFESIYFRVTSIIDTVNNSEFRYALRPLSDNWRTQWHPHSQMHFVGYGNFTDKNRQTSRYSTRTYERYLKEVNTWELSENNVAAQFGDLSNLSVFGLDMIGYSAYLNNIYMSGRIKQFEDLPLRMEVETGGDTAMAWGETLRVECRVLQGWDDVTARVSRWSVSRDTGVPADDALWGLKDKVRNFNGMLDLSLTTSENDLGRPLNGVTTLFTFRADVDGVNEAAVMELALG